MFAAGFSFRGACGGDATTRVTLVYSLDLRVPLLQWPKLILGFLIRYYERWHSWSMTLRGFG